MGENPNGRMDYNYCCILFGCVACVSVSFSLPFFVFPSHHWSVPPSVPPLGPIGSPIDDDDDEREHENENENENDNENENETNEHENKNENENGNGNENENEDANDNEN